MEVDFATQVHIPKRGAALLTRRLASGPAHAISILACVRFGHGPQERIHNFQGCGRRVPVLRVLRVPTQTGRVAEDWIKRRADTMNDI